MVRAVYLIFGAELRQNSLNVYIQIQTSFRALLASGLKSQHSLQASHHTWIL
jgi:hypothetical protein